MAHSKTVHFEKKSHYIWITLPDTLNVDTNQKVEKEIIDQLQEQNLRVVINCCNIQYLYSAGIGLMIRIRNHILKNNGLLWLVNVSAKCRENLTALRLDTIFTVFSTDVEFELSQNDLWEDKVSQDPLHFLCIHQIEHGICHISLTGNMTSKNDLSSFNNSMYTSDVSRYIFDFTELEMLDSYGVALLLNFIATLKKHHARYCSFGAKSFVYDLLILIGGEKIIPFCSDKNQSLETLGR